MICHEMNLFIHLDIENLCQWEEEEEGDIDEMINIMVANLMMWTIILIKIVSAV